MLDLTDTIQPKSDQLDACDLLTGPRVFTIARASKGNAEQPVNLHLAEFPRPWRPGKSMRRVLVYCWGKDATQYVGRKVLLYCDPDVSFGGQAVGGTRIRALSHIDGPKRVPLLVSRGKSAIFIVEPLPTDEPTVPLRTNDQARQLAALIRGSGLERDAALALFGGWIGHKLDSTKDLTVPEASVVIDRLSALNAGTDPDTGEVDYDGPLIPGGES